MGPWRQVHAIEKTREVNVPQSMVAEIRGPVGHVQAALGPGSGKPPALLRVLQIGQTVPHGIPKQVGECVTERELWV